MPLDKRNYLRLPGRARKNFGLLSSGRQILWLAADHLLIVSQSTIREQAYRIAFDDVQAMVVRKTTAGRIANGVLAVLSATMAVAAVAATYLFGALTFPTVFFFALAIVAIALILLNVLFGPTAVCLIYTVVKAYELTALGRYRTARRVSHTIRTHIETVQGQVTPETLDEGLDTLLSARLAPREVRRKKKGRTVSITHSKGNIHAALFVMLLVAALSSYLELFYTSVPKDAIDAILSGALLIVSIIAIFRSRDTDIPLPVRWLTYLVPVFYLVGTIFLTAASLTQITSADAFSTMVSPRKVLGPEGFVLFVFVNVIVQSVIGGLGLAFIVRHRWANTGQPIAPADISES